MKRIVLTGLSIVALSLPVAPATAQDMVADFTKGSVMLGYDNHTCDGTLEGAIRYNSAALCAEVCDGTGWTCPDASGDIICTAPALCPNIGDVCDDGNAGTTNDPLFAGFMVYANATCEPLYVTDNNQSTSSVWTTAAPADDIATDSSEDGQINDGQIADSAIWPPFKLCKDLTDGGFTDWYLPALEELDLLWANKNAIDANAAGAFSANDYWSSTERNNNDAWYHYLGDGFFATYELKDQNFYVRCVRRD